MKTPLRVCASRTHEFPAKMLHSTPSHRLSFESMKIVDIHNLVHRVQYMTIDSIAVRERLTYNVSRYHTCAHAAHGANITLQPHQVTAMHGIRHVAKECTLPSVGVQPDRTHSQPR